jgi:succinate dehydrogenase/fumarate reductase flavoprotein subunit
MLVPKARLTDDVMGMAFRAGCEMRNLELSMIGPTATHFGVLGANILLGEGAILVNARGARFMLKWDPVRWERAPRSVMGRAIATEEIEGWGPAYLDATHLDEMAHRRIEKAIPEVMSVLAKGGVDLRKDKVEWTTELGGLGPGGIRVNRHGATMVPGLYAAGACSDHGEDGVINIITHGMESAIGGDRAGRAAGLYAAQASEPKIEPSRVQALKSQIFSPLCRQSGIEYYQARQLCNVFRQEGLVGATRNARGLKRAIELAQEISQEKLPYLVARDYHEMAKVIGLGNELVLVELLARCALHRTESRGSHYREDFPHRDDARWLKWVIARKADGEARIFDEAIPLGDYPISLDLSSR